MLSALNRKLEKFCENLNIDGIIINDKKMLLYLIQKDFSGYLFYDGKVKIFTDERYFEKLSEFNTEHIKNFNIKKNIIIGIDEKNTSLILYDFLLKNNIEIKFINKDLLKMRSIKENFEIDNIKKAIEISEKSLSSLIKEKIIGKSEKYLSRKLCENFFKNDGDEVGFNPIIASGINSAIPHASPTNKIICENELLKIDFGVLYNNYNSDITRTFFMGKCSKKINEIYDIVKMVNLEIINMIKPNILFKSLHEKAVELFKEYSCFFTHGIGHGLGLNIHEAPFGEDILLPNMIITVEPGIYIKNLGGVRIEDDVRVTENGHEVLTKFTKDKIICQ